MRRFALSLSLATVALIAVAIGAATAQQSLTISGVDSDDFPEVVVEFTAPPGFDGELSTDEVTFTENGEARAFTLTQTAAEDIEVVLAIDTSGSMRGTPIEEAILAAHGFVESLPTGSRIALIGFGDEPTILAEFTTNRAAMLAAIDAIVVDPAAETALYDAVRLAAQQFDTEPTGPRYVLVVTDGRDTISEAAIGTAQAAVLGAGVPVHAVSLVTSESDPVALEALASETGGSVAEAADPVGLSELTSQLATAINAQYELRYTSQANGRTLLEVNVTQGEQAAQGSLRVDFPILLAPTPAPEPTPTPEPVIAAPTPPPEPVESIVVTTSSRKWLLPVGIVLLGLAMVVLFNFLLWPNRRRRRNPLKEMAPVAAGAAKASGGMLAAVSQSVLRGAEKLVAKRDDEGLLAHHLDRAGVRMRPAEYLVLVASVATVAAMLFVLLTSLAAAVLIFILVWVVAVAILNIKGNRRSRAFEEQLPVTLRIMGGALRGGFSLSQTVELVGNEANPPTSDEFARMAVEENLGRDIADSFRDVGKRMQSDDFKWVAEAVDINRSVGGDLSEVLENVTQTVRTRQRIKGQIKSLSAEGRLSAAILLAVPFVIFFGQLLTSPELPRELLNSTGGRILALVGLALMGIATLWMRRIVRLKY